MLSTDKTRTSDIHRREELGAACIASPLMMGRICAPNVFSLSSPHFHKDIEDCIQEKTGTHHNIQAPRGHAKTSVSVIAGVLWHLFCSQIYHGRSKGVRFALIVSKSRPHAINLLTTIKNILEFSSSFKAIFGYHGQAIAQTWAADFVILGNGSIICCRGMQQQVRGLLINGRRPTFIVGDDIEDEMNTKTPEAMIQSQRWFLSALCECGQPNDTVILNIGTPQHESCIVKTLPDITGWHSLHFRAINKDDDGVEYALWPEQRNLEWLKEKKQSLDDIGRVSFFYKEYQCEVIGDSDQMFKDKWIKYWNGELETDAKGKKFIVLKGSEDASGKPSRIAVNLYMGVDPASSLSSSADYTCIMVMALDVDGNRYIIDIFRERVMPVDAGQKIISMYTKYTPDKTQIETTAYQEMLRDYVKRESKVFIPGTGSKSKNNPRTRKSERIGGLQHLFYEGKVFLREGDDYSFNTEVFRQELLIFDRGKHDDTLDAFWYCNKGCYRPTHSEYAGSGKKISSRNRVVDWQVV